MRPQFCGKDDGNEASNICLEVRRRKMKISNCLRVEMFCLHSYTCTKYVVSYAHR